MTNKAAVAEKRRRVSGRASGGWQATASELCRRAGLAIANAEWAKAESLYGRVVAMGVVDANVYNNLATLYDRQGTKADEGLALLRKAYALVPENEEIRRNFLRGLTVHSARLAAERRFREALPLFQERVACEPTSAMIQRELGLCYAQLGELQTAVQYYTRAINLDPNEALFYNDLGLACYDLRMLAEAKGAFQQVLKLKPDQAVAYVHLGLLAHLTGLPAVAVNMLRRALEIDPLCGEAHNNMALFLRDQGMQKECREHYLESLRLLGNPPNIYSSYLLSLNDDPYADPSWVANEHKRFQTIVGGETRAIVTRDLNPSRRLRIGYLSPDFRQHSVAFFILPLLAAHDRSRVEVTCYSTTNLDDYITERTRGLCDRWRKVFRVADEDLAKLIAQDEIDILVELSGHTSGQRLAMLARRVAPIQMTYLGYPNTTGLAEMDYRITDGLADPPGISEALHSEKLIRIDGGFLTYSPAEWARDLPIPSLPGDETGHVTFGSFNNLAKINDVVLDAWARIIEGVPGSVLLLKAMGIRDERVRERIGQAFRARGLDIEGRITMLAQERAGVDHIRLYNRIDVALDTFPYNGTTTTFEALWMGTPVVALTGAAHAGRVGASLMARIGLDSLVCPTIDAYIATAIALGNDRERIRTLRRGLRERLLASPLMDAKRLARQMETAFAQSWRDYCEGVR